MERIEVWGVGFGEGGFGECCWEVGLRVSSGLLLSVLLRREWGSGIVGEAAVGGMKYF